jgi:hypothetical protein
MKLAVRSIQLFLLFFLVFAAQGVVYGQAHKRVIQLSGIILAEDSISGLPGVHIYVPKAGRGTSSLRNGYFSMAVLVGDSVVISSVGYARQHWIIPNSAPEFYTVIVEMVPDVTFLKEVTIMPFPTEEVFKQAVLALNMPLDNGIDTRNLNAELLALMMQTTPMDGNANYRYYMDQYPNSIRDQFQPRTNPFLNPFNWARFFRDLKQNKKK